MKRVTGILTLILVFAALAANAQTRRIFPYKYTVDELPNGLKLVTVPTDYPNLVSVYTIVRAGSRNEVEKGKTGYAHFFEHLMFRGSENYPAGGFDEVMRKAGASSNAYTTDDRTVYHATFAKEDLDNVLKLEADRFQRLKYSLEQYKTEAGAVRGEYDKNSASPVSKLYETLRQTAFKNHTYSHTTMGYIEDIKDFPNQFEYSWQFYNRFYRPEYTTLLVVGDVRRDEVLAKVRSYYGGWKRGDYKPQIPVEAAQDAPRFAHVEWNSPTQPYVAVAYRSPAFSDENKEKAALDLLAAVAFGENSELFQKLVLKEQRVDFVSPEFENRVDPELFWVFARLKKSADMETVKDEIIKTFQRFTNEKISQAELDKTRSRIRYGFAMQMNSNDAIASTLAPYIALRGTPDTVEKAFALYETVTPEDIRRAAAKYFISNNQTVVTLAAKKDQ